MDDTDDNINVTLISDFSEDQQNKLLGETIGCAVLDSGCTCVTDKNVMDIIQEVTDKCEICRKFKKPLPRPVVAFPTATSFCEVVAMDLKDILGVTVLHMIDHATRYSSACTVPNKKKETIVRAILQNWIRLFGSPDYFLSDNGGEFINDEFIER